MAATGCSVRIAETQSSCVEGQEFESQWHLPKVQHYKVIISANYLPQVGTHPDITLDVARASINKEAECWHEPVGCQLSP